MALRVPFKKLLAAAIVAAFAASPAAAQKKDGPKKDEPQINAPHAILIDAENGGVLYERDPDKLIFPASLAKLMTAEYVFHEIKEGRGSPGRSACRDRARRARRRSPRR